MARPTPFTPGSAAHSPVRCRASRTTVTCHRAATNILAIESSVVTPTVRRAVNWPGVTTTIHVPLGHWTPEPPPEPLPRSFRRTQDSDTAKGPASRQTSEQLHGAEADHITCSGRMWRLVAGNTFGPVSARFLSFEFGWWCSLNPGGGLAGVLALALVFLELEVEIPLSVRDSLH